jgi:hypothetical protein
MPMTINAAIRPVHLALIFSLAAGGPLFAQTRDEPLGEIWDSIEEAAQPPVAPQALPVPNAPVLRSPHTSSR